MKLSLDFFGLNLTLRFLRKESLMFYWVGLSLVGWDLISCYNTNNFKAGALKLLGIKVFSWLNKKIYILGKK